MKFGDESCEEELFVMFPGSTLENRQQPYGSWEPFNEEGSILMPDLFEDVLRPDEVLPEQIRLDSFVLREVYATIPRIDKYGVPDYANERWVPTWAREELGWNYLAYESDTGKGKRPSAVEVQVSDTGDDGGGRYWLEVSIRPEVAQKIVAAFTTAG